MNERGGTTRRQLLQRAAAGVAAGGVLSGAGPALAETASGHFRTPLWEVAQRRGVVYGGSISTWMYQGDPAYAHLFRREVAMLWPEDDFLWYRLRPSPTSGLDFTYPDMIVEFAERNRQLIIGAPGLVWDQGFGDGWTDNDLWGMDHKTASHVLYSSVRAMVRRYRGKVQTWIVCNEVTDPAGKNGLRTDVPWYNTIGPGYVAEAFHQAHEQDPHALLLLNEFGFDTVNQYGDQPVPRQKATLEVLDNLLEHDVPVHGLGIQAHLLATDYAHRFHAKEFLHFLHEVASRGLKIVISEMDVLDDGLPPNIKIRDRGVADVYSRFLDTALQEPEVIAVIQYGLSDRWTEENDDNPRPDGVSRRPCPFDTNLKPKPAFYAIDEALETAPRRHPYWVPPRSM
jgi:endo-1,4-beta-xylanase